MKKATTTGAASKTAVKKASAKRATTTSPQKAKPAVASAASAAPKVHLTSVVARIDVGFGNLLYIRGEGPGLSWDRGVPMECASSDTWTWSTTTANRPFAYKVLINDERWSVGDDYVASAGAENSIAPVI